MRACQALSKISGNPDTEPKGKRKKTRSKVRGVVLQMYSWSTAKLCRCSYSSNFGGSEKYESKFFDSLFHVASNKDNMYECKYNADRANNTQTFKPGTGLPKDITYKTRPKFRIKERHWIWKVSPW